MTELGRPLRERTDVGTELAVAAELADARTEIRSKGRGPLRNFPEIRVVGVLGVFIIFVTIFHPQFLSLGSVANITQQASLFGIIALGMVFMLSMEELDLSVAGNFASCTVIAALLARAGINPWIGGLLVLGVGAMLGMVNALISNALRVPIIVVSLGTLTAYRGLALVISGANSVSGGDLSSPFFTVLGGVLFGIPFISVAFVALTIALSILYRRTSFGFSVRAIGSNSHAARLSGYPIGRRKIQVAALLGALCGVSGVLSFAFFGAADPSVGGGYELLVIAAAVIGGTALSGGRGSVVGALFGALIVSVINAALTAFGVSINYVGLVTGAVIVGAVALDSLLKRRSSTS